MKPNRRSVMLGAAAAVGVAPVAFQAASPVATAARLLSGRLGAADSGGSSDASTAGLRLGPENNAYFFSGAVSGSRLLGQTFGGLGPNLFRAVHLPQGYANIPAAGDHWLVLFFRTAAIGFSTVRQETLLGVQGGSVKAGTSFGGIYFNSTVVLTGTQSGLDIAPAAGLVQCQRKIGGYSLWPQSTPGAPTTLRLAADTDYALFFGLHDVGGVDYGQITLVRMADLNVQTVQSPMAVSVQRATSAPLFDCIGAVGVASSTTDALGFGGSVGDFAVFNAPFPSPAQAAIIAGGGVPMAGVTAVLGAGTLAYWNTLDATAISGGTLPALVGPPATILGANTVPTAPIRRPSTVALTRLGSHYVFPIACGGSDGNVWFEGSAPPGAVVNCQLRYLDGSLSSPAAATANAAGAFAVGLRSPGGKPFHRVVAPASGGASYVDGDLMDVGIVIPMFGQSEVNVINAWSGGVSPTLFDAAHDNAGHSLPQPGSYTGPWAAWIDLVNLNGTGIGNLHNRGEGARPQIMLGNGMPGDGTVKACAEVMAATGYSVMIALVTRSGTPMDAMLLDGQTFTTSPAITGSGAATTPFALTLTIGPTDGVSPNPALAAKYGLPGLILTGKFIPGVAPGSVSITFPNGGAAVTVTDVFAGYADSGACTGKLVGGNGATGAINYMTGQVTLSFATPPITAGCAATWTIKQEMQDGNYASKTAKINGFGVREAVDETCRLALRHGWTLAWHWWITSDLGEVTTVAATIPDLGGKLTLLQQMMTGGPCYPGYLAPGLALDPGCASPPMVLVPKGRELVSIELEALGKFDVARQTAQALWPGQSNPLSFVLAGGWYLDQTMDSTTGTGHSDHSDQGGRRVGRRVARDWLAAFRQDRSINRGPEFGTPTFSGAVCTVPVSYIGPGLRLVTPGNASALSEWYVGGATSKGTIVDNAAFARAAIREDGLAVVITKLSGNWLGNEAIRYIIGCPGDLLTNVYAPPSLLYDNRGGFEGFEPGLPAAPRFP